MFEVISNSLIFIISYNYVGNTGNKYPIATYINHGKGGIYKGFKDLPKDEYPYTIEYVYEYNFTKN